jgi:hypothetical protein
MCAVDNRIPLWPSDSPAPYGERMSRTSSLAAVVLAASIVFVVAGCGDDTPTPPVETPVAEAPSETPTPTPEALEPFDATCENIVTQETLDGFADNGVKIIDQQEFVDKMKGEGQEKWVELDAAGGTICWIANDINAVQLYGYGFLTGDQANSIIDKLYDEGFSVDTTGTIPGQWFSIDEESIDTYWFFETPTSDSDVTEVFFGPTKERVEEIHTIVKG